MEANLFDCLANQFELDGVPFLNNEVYSFITDFGLIVKEVSQDSSLPDSTPDDFIFNLLCRCRSVSSHTEPIGGVYVRLPYSRPICLVFDSCFLF